MPSGNALHAHLTKYALTKTRLIVEELGSILLRIDLYVAGMSEG